MYIFVPAIELRFFSPIWICRLIWSSFWASNLSNWFWHFLLLNANKYVVSSRNSWMACYLICLSLSLICPFIIIFPPMLSIYLISGWNWYRKIGIQSYSNISSKRLRSRIGNLNRFDDGCSLTVIHLTWKLTIQPEPCAMCVAIWRIARLQDILY